MGWRKDTRAIIRAYPELKRRARELHDVSLTANPAACDLYPDGGPRAYEAQRLVPPHARYREAARPRKWLESHIAYAKTCLWLKTDEERLHYALEHGWWNPEGV